jgi:hypothetical protein
MVGYIKNAIELVYTVIVFGNIQVLRSCVHAPSTSWLLLGVALVLLI